MPETFRDTESLCPVCLQKIPAQVVEEDGRVYLKKDCTEHGNVRTLVWRDASTYKEWGAWQMSFVPQQPRFIKKEDCPFVCGLCSEHLADTCSVVFEVTNRCNLNCPVCFAKSNEVNLLDPSLSKLKEELQAIVGNRGPFLIQLSGGEPTLRDDLPELISMIKNLGFKHVQVNTNGLRIAYEPDYLRKLKENGADVIYLQFDGLSDEIYRKIRGQKMLNVKQQAIRNCENEEMGVVFVVTLMRNVNFDQIGRLVEFAKSNIPTVKGLHFQPIAYFGRHPAPPQDDDRVTLDDVWKALEDQTAGMIKQENFVPEKVHPYCTFSGLFVLLESGEFLPISNYHRSLNECGCCGGPSPSEHWGNFISEYWRFRKDKEIEQIVGQDEAGSWIEFFKRSQTHYLTISCMPFQDAWTIDLNRLKRCCIHVLQENRLVPLCARYLTSTTGQRLY
ncbi:radical SAM protein [candidate division WWE3 bacterium]|jgi:uncharacterized radical SAM superfamily Fe-S cluster-containing enzyme|uniref:Radical SAM protein n=1 Tax=candidate division WWE3 bacterium TaxID=2053526 RepID=A0A3A4ZDE3_UNCKA|nr:MAG: radical SAM protein [candidate division WWE3 bacterium]